MHSVYMLAFVLKEEKPIFIFHCTMTNGTKYASQKHLYIHRDMVQDRQHYKPVEKV